jgi:hypothetical protein
MNNTEIVKFCIYYKIQPKTDTYLARIATSRNGKCSPTFHSGWFLGAVFYGWKNDIRPFPPGTLLFRATFKTSLPYNTILVKPSFDPFFQHPNAVNFVTYSQPAPNIIPLYLYHKNQSVFPTFKHIPGWEQDILSPIYIMWDFYTDFGSNFMKRNKVVNPNLSKLGNYSKFSCVNLICVPDQNSNKSFLECFKLCLEKGKKRDRLRKKLGMDPRLYELSQMANKKSGFLRFFGKASKGVWIAILVIFGLSLIFLLVLLFLKLKK